MSTSDFLNTPEALRQHEANTAAIFIYYFREGRKYFDAMWQEATPERRRVVIERMRQHGATAAELAQLK